MGVETKIEWCDHSASPWHGCTEVHAGCDNCYARTMAKRNPGTLGVWGKDGTRVMSASFAKNCRRWNKEVEEEARCNAIEVWRDESRWREMVEPKSVFPSICDPFEDWQGPILNAKGERLYRERECNGIPYGESFPRDLVRMDDLRRNLFELIDECQNLRFLLLTKRPENVRRMWMYDVSRPIKETAFRKNVAVFASVSDQATANAMIPPLLKCRDLVPTLGVSLEPMLAAVDLTPWLESDFDRYSRDDRFGIPKDTSRAKIDWVIVGGESGHNARPMEPAWAMSVRRQCQVAGVPFFFKQGSQANWPAFKDFDSFPAELQVREYPDTASPSPAQQPTPAPTRKQ